MTNRVGKRVVVPGLSGAGQITKGIVHVLRSTEEVRSFVDRAGTP